MRKKMLALLSCFVVAACPMGLAVSCSTSKPKLAVPKSVKPTHGWPPVDKGFLVIWEAFYQQTQEDMAKIVRNIIDFYSSSYQSLYAKYKDIKTNEAVDGNGVPNAEVSNILNQIASSQDMCDYEMYTLRLFNIEMNISSIKREDHKRVINTDEEYTLWTMNYYGSHKFFEWAKIPLIKDGTAQIYETGIDFNFYDDWGLQIDTSTGNPNWQKGPHFDPKPGEDEPKKFIPKLKMPEVYQREAHEIYNELFK